MSKQEQTKKMYELVIDQIYEDVKNGRLKTGDKLPSERQLNESLGISRASIREGLRALEAIGLITSQHGEGNFINGDFTEALLPAATSFFILSGGTRRNALDMRMHLECLSVRTAAMNISPHELDDLESLLGRMKGCDDLDQRLDMDRQFHKMIAESTGNVLLVSLLQIVNYITNIILSTDNQEEGPAPELRMRIETAHHNLLTALREGNPSKAEHVMRHHLTEAFNRAMASDSAITEADEDKREVNDYSHPLYRR